MNRIKELRSLVGIKQAELARAVNVSQAAMSGYETGRYEPDFDTLKKIALYLNVSIDYLLGGDKKEPPATVSGDEELTDPLEKQLMHYVSYLTREQKEFLLAQMKTMRERQ